MDRMLWEEENKKCKKEAIVVAIMIIVCAYCFFLSLTWIINSNYKTSDIEIIQYEDIILEVEEEPLILYSQDVLWAIKTEKGKTILLTEQYSDYVNEKIILSMKRGEKISYQIDGELKNSRCLEVMQLCYEGQELFSLKDSYDMLMEGRVSGWFVMPICIIGVIIFSIDLNRCWKQLRRARKQRY